MLSRILGQGADPEDTTTTDAGTCGDVWYGDRWGPPSCACNRCPTCGKPYWPHGTWFPSYPQIVWTTC